ncbi:MAG TPA: glycoside hydrolase family 30 beta sandwich domain-containing protein [Solirubrobacteraceae bacterium]|nr:glycoside hydrolase family 30 beta sandwich domain-containing protein [Solirubrobacteraceae bacterium]
MRAHRGRGARWLLLGLILLLAGGVSAASAQATTRHKPKPKPKPSPVVLAVHVPKLHGPVVQTVLTTFDEHYALRRMPSQYFVTQTSNRPVIKVDDHVRYQRMIGFGAAMTDSSAWLIQDELTTWQRNRVLRQLFSPSQGIGLNVTRVPIGASDFTATGVPYTYDDNPPSGQPDPSLSNFSIAHDTPYIIPALTEMLAENPQTRIISTAWSPPAWMKANDQLNDIGAHGTLLSQDYQPLADYFVKFIQAYQALGVPIWAITPENEPQSSAQFPSMWLPAADEAQFITQDLLPALQQNGLHPRIFGLDGTTLPYAQTLEQSAAAAHLAGMAWHCYGGSQTMGQFHAAYPAVVNLTTECSPGIIPYGAAEATLSALNNSASLVQLWNLALDPQGGPVQPPNSGCHRCTGLVVVDPATRRAKLRRNYYQLGQFSEFIRRGARRVAATRFVTEFKSSTAPHYGVTPGLDDVAFLDPGGRRVLVVYNNAPTERYFAVQWDAQKFQYKLPPKAIVTFTWRPGKAGGATSPAR